MKKNIILLVSLIAVAFSYGARAKEKWIPKYQKNKVALEKEKSSTSSIVGLKGLNPDQVKLIKMYQKEIKGSLDRKNLSDKTMKLAQVAVPVLTKVMKDSAFPDNNRWLATFMLGRIMGKKSASFISKFSRHPNWMLRLASLKVLLALGQRQYLGIYGNALKDKALIVRHQALDNINKMKLKRLAPNVWGMLYDESNYKGSKGKLKRSNIIKDVVLTIGNLGFEKAKIPMLKMIQNKKYKDIFAELDSSLSKISGKSSPKGNITSKQFYWSRQAIKDKTI